MPRVLEYPPEHWSNDTDAASALAKACANESSLFERVEKDFILSLLPKSMNELAVLDYGCGCGLFSVLCAERGARVTGIDASAHAIRAANLYASQKGVTDLCNFMVGSEVQGQHFDVVIVKDVIEHIQDDSKYVHALADALNPNGQLVLSTHNKWSLSYAIEGSYHRLWHRNLDWIGWDPTHVRFYTPITIKRILEASGMKVDRWVSMYIVPYDILTWLSLLRKNVTLPSLRYIDYLLGKVFPFNRLGWEVIVSCRKVSPVKWPVVRSRMTSQA